MIGLLIAFHPVCFSWNYTEFDSAWAADARRHRCRQAVGPATRDTGLCATRSEQKSKPGLTAFTAGSRAIILLHVSTALPLIAPDERPAKRLATDSGGEMEVVRAERSGELLVTYLSSYEGYARACTFTRYPSLLPAQPQSNVCIRLTAPCVCSMGSAILSCVHGCACAPAILDGHRGATEASRFVSIYTTEKVPVTLRTNHCNIEVEIMNRTASGGHKFKISELALRWLLTDTVQQQVRRRAPC